MPTMSVKGNSCGHCVSAVTKAVAAVPGAVEVAVDLQKGEASWKDADPGKPADVEAIRRAVRELRDAGAITLVEAARPGRHARYRVCPTPVDNAVDNEG